MIERLCTVPKREHVNKSPPPPPTLPPQAHLPLGPTSLKMGTNDGGRTVLNECENLDRCTAQAAKMLRLRAHKVGGTLAWQAYRDTASGEVKRRKTNVGGQVLHAAADVEGHEGADSRWHLGGMMLSLADTIV